MGKRLFLGICLLLIFGGQVIGQKVATDSSYAPRLVVGSSLTYKWGDPTSGHFKEFTWAKNIAFSPFKGLYIGVNHLNVWNSSDYTPPRKAMLVGGFAQYHLGNYSIRFVPELGYYRGNYCTCGDDIPYGREGINYISVGAGFETNLYKGLQLDLSFLVYQPLLPRHGLNYAYSFTQYVIGLNYEFRFERRSKSNKLE